MRTKMKTIQLSQGKVAIVDDIDFESVSKYKWTYSYSGKSGIGYALNNKGSGRIYLHHFIMGKSPNLIVDHINGNSLDNRRANLRFVTHQQNQMNRIVQSNNLLGVKGVSLSGKKYRARIRVNGKTIELGNYESFDQAKNAYEKASAEHFREFRRTD